MGVDRGMGGGPLGFPLHLFLFYIHTHPCLQSKAELDEILLVQGRF